MARHVRLNSKKYLFGKNVKKKLSSHLYSFSTIVFVVNLCQSLRPTLSANGNGHASSKKHDKVLTVSNIKNGFKSCGIYSLCPGIIPNEAFKPSEPRDTPLFT